MSRRVAYFMSIVAVGLLAATPARLGAETFDRLTYLTFGGSVQIPGTRLDAGTYRFRLANPSDSRNVMQVLSYDGSTVYAMFHTIPDSRTIVTEEPTVTFRETPAGVPPAVKSLFYGGEHRGYEFVYPRGGPDVTADVFSQPEIVYSPRPTAAVSDSSAVIEAAPDIAPAPDVAETAAPAVIVESQPQVVELPRTASSMPLVAFGGFSSIILGLSIGLFRRFSNE